MKPRCNSQHCTEQLRGKTPCRRWPPPSAGGGEPVSSMHRKWPVFQPLFLLKSRGGRGTLFATSDRPAGGKPVMARLDLNALTLWITAAAHQQPQDLASQVMERAGVSRATANKALRRLA